MKAVRIHTYGGPETLVYEESSRPEPAANQVLIRMYAAGVNPIDWKIREGWFKEVFDYPLPLILGTDMSGRVEAVGTDVTDLQPGQEVYGVVDMTLSGAYAEYAVGHAEAIALKPQTLDFLQAATVPIVAMTAWQGLFEVGGLTVGQTVLVQAAAGGVGSFAVQFAKLHGLKVIGTASTSSLDYVRDLGADEVIDYRTTSFEQVVRDVDMVFDTLGGDVQVRSLDVLKPDGILVSTVNPPDQALATQKGVRATLMMVQPRASLLKTIADLIDSSKLKLPPIQVLPLTAARQAHEQNQTGHGHGKFVLQVRESH